MNCYSLVEFDVLLESEFDSSKLVINFPSHRALKKILGKKYRIVEAGGGLVVNANKEILFIFRKGKWDLPKGKLEKKEKIKEGAIREVEEECGITNPMVQNELITTFHKYSNKRKDCLKKTYWFLMNYDGAEELVPQKEEGITKVKWISRDKLHKVYKNTFPSIEDVLTVYLERFPD